MMEELKPCPFCCSKDFVFSSSGIDQDFITCLDCGAEGPVATGENDAVVAWNRRVE